MTISMEMVLPGLAGYWIDQRLGTRVVFMLVGFAVGMFVAMKHLLHSIKKSEARNRTERKTPAAENKTNLTDGTNPPDGSSPPTTP